MSQAVRPCFRFPLGLCLVGEMLAVRGIIVSHETGQSGPFRRALSASSVGGCASLS